MSLYPHTHYGQPYGYNQPVVGYSYPQPLPPPVYHVDPNTFRRDYSLRLADLTINSRPIIQNLSMLAQEYSRFAEIVGQCIEAHIRRVPPWMKLPAFYLLDAISKNVFEPYARHFATFVIPLFLETYDQVDHNTRSKMEEMLLTWRTGAPNGKELFGVGPQVNIERGIWGGEPTESIHATYSGVGQVSKSQVLSELEFTLGQKERVLQANPYDSVAQNHVAVLQQLRKLVDAGVSQEELQQILNQLRAFGRSAPPPPPAPHPAYHGSLPHAPQAPYSDFNPQMVLPPAQQPSHSQHPGHSYANYNQSQGGTDPSSIASLPTPRVEPPTTSTAISSLFDALVKAGVVSATATSAGDATKEESKAEPVDLERESSRAYRKSILAQSIKLTSAEITKRRPQIFHFLYHQLPVQCKQCGIRFADDVLGKKRMQDHLDMHFRQNRKTNQNIGRGHSRSWFVDVEDWIHDVPSDAKGKGVADGYRRLNAKAAAAAEVAKRDAELRAQFVVVPPGDEAKTISCPICKEVLKSEFLEDDEEWVWKDAIMKDDRVYHATCHAEAVVSTNTLAARLRTELAQRSRSGTPEAQSLRSTPPRATNSVLTSDVRKSGSLPPESKKRKIASNTTLREQVDGTPPLKKVALTA